MLSDFWPRPVPLPFGADTYPVSQYQIRDLAHFERFAADPGEFWRDLADAEAVPDAPTRHGLLRALYDRAERGLAGWGGADLLVALDTPYGRLETLWVSLVKASPDLTRADIVPIAMQATEDQWRTFDRVAWHLDPLDEVARVIDDEIGVSFPADPGSPRRWERAIARVIRRTGWTLEQVGALTLGQFEAICRAGAKPVHAYAEPDSPPKGWGWERFDREVSAPRAVFWATTPAEA